MKNVNEIKEFQKEENIVQGAIYKKVFGFLKDHKGIAFEKEELEKYLNIKSLPPLVPSNPFALYKVSWDYLEDKRYYYVRLNKFNATMWLFFLMSGLFIVVSRFKV